MVKVIKKVQLSETAIFGEKIWITKSDTFHVLVFLDATGLNINLALLRSLKINIFFLLSCRSRYYLGYILFSLIY